MRNRISFFLLPFMIIFIFVSCLDASATGTLETSFEIVTWNVQNLFDEVDNGTEYEEYTSAQGWNDTAYRERLRNIAEVLSYDDLKDASIIVLNEVENEKVIKDILNLSSVSNRGFCYYALAKEDGGAINIGVISKVPIYSVRIHKFDECRPILQVEFRYEERPLFLLAIHAKSNLGDAETDKNLRFELGTSLNEISEFLLLNNPSCSIVIAGDFNESVNDLNMMADKRLASNYFTDCPLLVSDSNRNGYWNSLWLNPSENFDAEGSYFYNDSWEQLDNILVKNAEIASCGVVFEKILKSSTSVPSRWNRYMLSGVSDHLPVWVVLR